MLCTEYEHETTLLELSGDISFTFPAFRTSQFPPDPSLLLSHTSHVVGAFRIFSKGSDLQQRSLLLLGIRRRKIDAPSGTCEKESKYSFILQFNLCPVISTCGTRKR